MVVAGGRVAFREKRSLTTALGGENNRGLAQEAGDKLRGFGIVDAEHLQDRGVGKESPGASAIGGAQLMKVLQDRP